MLFFNVKKLIYVKKNLKREKSRLIKVKIDISHKNEEIFRVG